MSGGKGAKKEKKRPLRKRRRWGWSAALVLLTAWLLWGNLTVGLTKIDVFSTQVPAEFEGYRIAHISDLHNASFGSENGRLLKVLRDAEPDIIAITGDLIDSRRTDIPAAVSFAREAMKIAPCYYVTGNHEARSGMAERLKEELEAAGVIVLENERVEIARDGARIVVLGVEDPAFYAGTWRRHAAGIISEHTTALMKEGDGFTIALSHRAELFDAYAECGVDLALCGHAHGGQFRLPFLGGVAAPNQGFFPEYDAGLFTRGETNMVVSRGIGNSIFPLRINNRPEVVLIRLQRMPD